MNNRSWRSRLLVVISILVLVFGLMACGPAGGQILEEDRIETTQPEDMSQEAPKEEQLRETPEVENPAGKEPGLVEEGEAEQSEEAALDPEGSYTTKEDVSLYLYLYGELPSNFITKKEAKALGWTGGGLEEYAPGKCIGGDYFGNYEGLLPEEKDREYHECDIDTLGASKRGAKRIIYSNDGLIYYTEDHYASFELLYGEP